MDDSSFVSMGLFSFAYAAIIILNSLKIGCSSHHPINRKPKTLKAPKGSFLLKKHGLSQSLAFEVLEKYKKELAIQERSTNLHLENVTTPRTSEIGKSLIQSHDQSMGPNLSLFYKNDGGLIVEKGKGVYMVRNLTISNTLLCLFP